MLMQNCALIWQVAKMKLMGMEIKQSFGVRMDGSMFDDV